MAVHLSVLVIGATVIRVGVVPAEVCPDVTVDQVKSASRAAVDWLVSGQEPSGRFTYGYHRGDDRVNTGYNEARHGGVVMSLFQAHAVLGSEAALAGPISV